MFIDDVNVFKLPVLLSIAVNLPFAEDVNLKVIAERTPGFSGADLFSLMNEGAILAARESRQKVSQFDLRLWLWVGCVGSLVVLPQRLRPLL